VIALLMLACGDGTARETAAEPELLDTGAAPDPGFDDDALAVLATDAFEVVMGVGMAPAWAGMGASLAAVEGSCPAVYDGPPPSLAKEAETGWSWEDACATDSGAEFLGHLWWSASLEQVEGQGKESARVEGTRSLVGEAAVQVDGALRFGFRGSFEDSLSQSLDETAPDWRYSAILDGVVTGDAVMQAEGSTPGGWGADGFFSTKGGVQQTFSMAVDVSFEDPALDGQLQAAAATLAWSELLVGVGCDLEPAGILSFLTTGGAWIDLGFESGTGDVKGASTCDGCAHLSVDGEPTGRFICTDLRFVWDGRLAPPGLEEFVDTPRAIGLEGA
jgi:hypothetical protein